MGKRKAFALLFLCLVASVGTTASGLTQRVLHTIAWHNNFQDDPTFDLGYFLERYPDQLAIIQPLMQQTDPTSPVIDYRLERLVNARSEGEARLILDIIREDERRRRHIAAGSIPAIIIGGALAIAVDTLVLFVLVYAIAELWRVRGMSTAELPETDWFGSNRRRL